MTRLGYLLNLDRRLRGEGVRAAAKRFGMSPTTFCNLEKGKPMQPGKFLEMLKWLLKEMPTDLKAKGDVK